MRKFKGGILQIKFPLIRNFQTNHEQIANTNEPLPGVLGNTGTVAFIFREQGIFSNYFQGTGELLTRLLGSFLGTRGFSNGEQGIKSKKVKGSWEHAPPPWEGLLSKDVRAKIF